MPIGVPHAVSPNVEKLDLNRLKEDIPKYGPWISSSSATVWNTFMAKNLEDHLSTPESGDEWIMQDVFQQERPPPSESTSSREDNPELAAMFAAEHESCQVQILILVHSSDFSEVHGWRTFECFEKHYVQVKTLTVSFGRWACFHTLLQSVHHGCCPYLCKIYDNHLVYIILVSIQIYIPIL